MAGSHFKRCFGRIPRTVIMRAYSIQSNRMNILFFGTDNFAVKHLEALNKNRNSADTLVDRLEVVVPKGPRSQKMCAVEKYADVADLCVTQCPVMDHGRYDLGIVVSFGHLISKEVIESFPRGVLNVHPSALPCWRGAAPIQHTLLSGEPHTAVTVMQIVPDRFDVGPIIAQQQCDVLPNITLSELRKYLAAKGSSLLIDTLRDLAHRQSTASPQATTGVTHAFKFNQRHARVNWDLQSVCDVDRQYRAIGVKFDLRSEFDKKPIRLGEMIPVNEFEPPLLLTLLPNEKPGSIHYDRISNVLCVRCKDGLVGFRRVVMKKPMTAKAFYNGYMSKFRFKGTVLASLKNHLDSYFDETPDAG